MDALNDPAPVNSNQPSNHSFNVRFDLRWVVVLLLVAVAVLLGMWRPWQSSGKPSDDRTINVTGEATLQAEADNFVFYPSYEFDGADGDASLKALSAKSDEIVAKLKALGVSDTNIKTNANGYEKGGIYYPAAPTTTQTPGPRTNSGQPTTYNLQLTVTATSREQAQKVQNYLASTSPTGAITPNPVFSDQKRKSLESQARDAATKDARSKADQSAKNLGFKVGGVKAVNDGSGFGVTPAYDSLVKSSSDETTSVAPAPDIAVQPGQNSLSYSVTVVYYVK